MSASPGASADATGRVLRIGLVTTDVESLGFDDPDIEPLRQSLAEAGFEVTTPIWHDAQENWANFDAVVMRSPWDYTDRYAEFTAWLQRAAAATTVFNAPDLIIWNTDKLYLAEFADRGLPIIPSGFCDDIVAVTREIEALDSERVVIKPSVSAGAIDTGLFNRMDPAALELAGRILAVGKTVIVQPAVEYLATHGENAIFFFDGAYSHTVHKGPILAHGGGYASGSYTEQLVRADPSAAERELAERTLQVIAQIAGERGMAESEAAPLYARIDVALADGTDPQVIEAELSEPSYFSHIAPEALDNFVAALQRRLRATAQ